MSIRKGPITNILKIAVVLICCKAQKIMVFCLRKSGLNHPRLRDMTIFVKTSIDYIDLVFTLF